MKGEIELKIKPNSKSKISIIFLLDRDELKQQIKKELSGVKK